MSYCKGSGLINDYFIRQQGGFAYRLTGRYILAKTVIRTTTLTGNYGRFSGKPAAGKPAFSQAACVFFPFKEDY